MFAIEYATRIEDRIAPEQRGRSRHEADWTNYTSALVDGLSLLDFLNHSYQPFLNRISNKEHKYDFNLNNSARRNVNRTIVNAPLKR